MDPNEREKQNGAADESVESNAARRLRAQGVEVEDSIHEGEAARGSRIANFWYHHKWKVIVGAAFAVIVISAVSQLLSQSNPDVSLLYAGPVYITPNSNEAFCDILEGLMDDYNGDGRKYAQLNDVVFLTDKQIEEYETFCLENGEDNTLDRLANAQAAERFSYQVFGGEALICIFAEEQYKMVAESGGFDSLTELFGTLPEGAVDDYGIRFSEMKLAKFYDAAKMFPEDAILALRSVPTLSAFTGRKKAEEKHARNEALFRKMVEFEYPEGYVE